MKVKFSTLWIYCLSWAVADVFGIVTGWWGSADSFKEDGAVAFFIALVWALEKLLPMPRVSITQD